LALRLLSSEEVRSVRTQFLAATAAALLLAVPVAARSTKAHPSKAKRHTPVKHTAKATSITKLEEEAWGGSAKRPVKKTPAKVASDLKPTVTPTGSAKPSVGTTTVAAAPTAKPTPAATTTKPEKTEVASTNTDAKSAEEQEKAAKAMIARDPKAAFAMYRKFLDSNQDYRYLGDAYVDAYAAAERGGASIIDKLEMAGKAAKYLREGRSRGPVDQSVIQKYDALTDKWTNEWINTEIQKALAGK
jgi:hypothetical protein